MGLRVTAMLAMAGALIGFFVSFLVPHSYVGSTTLRFNRGDVAQTIYEAQAKHLADAVAAQIMSDATLTAMIQRETTLKEMAPLYAGDELKDLIRASVNIRQVSLPDRTIGLDITYKDEDADRALSIDREVSFTVAWLVVRESTMSGSRQVAEVYAAPHKSLAGTTPALLSGIGLGCGILIGISLWILSPRN